MDAPQDSEMSSSFHSSCSQPTPSQVQPYVFSGSRTGASSGQSLGGEFYTLESTPDFVAYNPSAASIRSPFSPQDSHYSLASDHQHSPDLTVYDSAIPGSSGVEDENKLMHALWVLRNELLGPESDTDDIGCFGPQVIQPSPFSRYDRILEKAPNMDLKKLLITCAEVVAEADTISDRQVALSAAEALIEILEKRVSVSGDPLERLGAYMLEGVRARLLHSGSTIYKRLKCKEPINPTSSELMSYMHVIYEICPYYKFAYVSSSVIISETMENESRIHIIDFQIAQGSQWVSFIQSVSRRPAGPPYLRITGVDDPQSAHARGGGLQLVGLTLANVARSCGVPFEFHGAAISGSEVQWENLGVQHGEAVAVNFPYALHHIPDENVSIENHRDRLLRLVRSLSPKVVTLIEQESNTNATGFLQRFQESLNYYVAMFESIDAACQREDKKRISTEEHCVARDVVNIIACEGPDRVERHEPFGKWRRRFAKAGFSPVRLSPTVGKAVCNMLKEYSSNYTVGEGNGALYLGWKNRAMSTCSAWR